jgi:hypothetical protein
VEYLATQCFATAVLRRQVVAHSAFTLAVMLSRMRDPVGQPFFVVAVFPQKHCTGGFRA